MEGLINFSGTSFSNSKKTMVTVDFTTNCPKRRAGNPCPYCLTGDSKILMSDFSQKKIKDIKIGDKIAGFDENGKIKLQESTVLNLSKKRKSKVYNVKLENGYEIKITDNHPIRASHPEKGLKWLTIDDFKSGKYDDFKVKFINLIETKIPRKSLIAFMGHGKNIIGGSKIASIEECDEEYVYNFESTSGTYIANGILVHNCYVEVARRIKERKPKFYLAKKVYDYRAYNHELIKRKVFKNPETIKMINDSGGLRLFSFGDYMPEHDNDIKGLLDDAAKIGLDVKAITKVPEFVHKFHDYPALKEINISIDFIGHGIEHKTALELQKKYKKVSIRAVVLNDKELEDDFMEYVDIITFNHEKLGDVDIGKSIKNYSKKEIQKFFKDNPKYGVCCITGRCATCPIKCGKRKYSQDCLMM